MGESQSHHGLWSCGHVMLEGTFPRVELEQKTSPQRFVAANGEQIRDLGERTNYSIQDKRGNSKMHNIQKCECCQTFHFNAESFMCQNHCGAG